MFGAPLLSLAFPLPSVTVISNLGGGLSVFAATQIGSSLYLGSFASLSSWFIRLDLDCDPASAPASRGRLVVEIILFVSDGELGSTL